MKCLAGVEFPGGKPCPKCNAKLGDVCWPGINAELLELEQLRAAMASQGDPNIVAVLRANHKEAIEAKRRVETRLRIALASLQQIYTVCNDNAADTCDARMALNFVRDAACNGFEAATTRRTSAVAQAQSPGSIETDQRESTDVFHKPSG